MVKLYLQIMLFFFQIMFWNTFTNKVKVNSLNVWLVGCRQDDFLVVCKIKTKDPVLSLSYPEKATAVEVIPESGFSKSGLR